MKLWKYENGRTVDLVASIEEIGHLHISIFSHFHIFTFTSVANSSSFDSRSFFDVPNKAPPKNPAKQTPIWMKVPASHESPFQHVFSISPDTTPAAMQR